MTDIVTNAAHPLAHLLNIIAVQLLAKASSLLEDFKPRLCRIQFLHSILRKLANFRNRGRAYCGVYELGTWGSLKSLSYCQGLGRKLSLDGSFLSSTAARLAVRVNLRQGVGRRT